MSEEAPVNIGAVEWPDPGSAYFMVRRMQTKLHRWAGEDPSRRFGDLHNLVCDPAFLVHAWERVSTNKGAKTAGIDKATAAMIENWVGVGAFLGQIRDSLKSGEFRPAEVRQVMIPKGNTGKFRKLGIPTIADRVVQASLRSPAVRCAGFVNDGQVASWLRSFRGGPRLVTDRVVPVFGRFVWLAGSRRVVVLPDVLGGGTGSDCAGVPPFLGRRDGMAGQAGAGSAHSRAQQVRNASFHGQVRLIFSTRARAWRASRAGRLSNR